MFLPALAGSAGSGICTWSEHLPKSELQLFRHEAAHLIARLGDHVLTGDAEVDITLATTARDVGGRRKTSAMGSSVRARHRDGAGA